MPLGAPRSSVTRRPAQASYRLQVYNFCIRALAAYVAERAGSLTDVMHDLQIELDRARANSATSRQPARAARSRPSR